MNQIFFCKSFNKKMNSKNKGLKEIKPYGKIKTGKKIKRVLHRCKSLPDLTLPMSSNNKKINDQKETSRPLVFNTEIHSEFFTIIKGYKKPKHFVHIPGDRQYTKNSKAEDNVKQSNESIVSAVIGHYLLQRHDLETAAMKSWSDCESSSEEIKLENSHVPDTLIKGKILSKESSEEQLSNTMDTTNDDESSFSNFLEINTPDEVETEKVEMVLNDIPTDIFKYVEDIDNFAFLDYFPEILYSSEYSDVTVVLGDEAIDCHMIVLTSYSDYFRKAIRKSGIIVLPEDSMDMDIFACIYEWMLFNDPILCEYRLIEIFNAAEYLEMDELINQCWSFVDNEDVFINESAFELYIAAKMFKKMELQIIMAAKIQKYFLHMVASDIFLNLTCDELVYLLSQSSLHVSSEIQIFMTAYHWLQHDWLTRSQFIKRVLATVRFPLLEASVTAELRQSVEVKNLGKYGSKETLNHIIDTGLVYSVNTDEISEEILNCEFFSTNKDYKHLYERPLVVDETWDSFLEINTIDPLTTYTRFLDYLRLLNTLNKDAWRDWECREFPIPC